MYSDIILQTFDAFQEQALQSDVLKAQSINANGKHQRIDSRHWLLHASNLSQVLSKRSLSPCTSQRGQGKGSRSKSTRIGVAA